jgi:broad specificity phosphatase PhoE
MRMALVYLLRHGEADYQPITERGWPGAAADLAPLSGQGVEQARQAADGLAGAGATAVVASPMTRALQTAAIVAVLLGLPLSVQFDLREWLPDDTFSWRSVDDVRAAVTTSMLTVASGLTEGRVRGSRCRSCESDARPRSGLPSAACLGMRWSSSSATRW